MNEYHRESTCDVYPILFFTAYSTSSLSKDFSDGVGIQLSLYV